MKKFSHKVFSIIFILFFLFSSLDVLAVETHSLSGSDKIGNFTTNLSDGTNGQALGADINELASSLPNYVTANIPADAKFGETLNMVINLKDIGSGLLSSDNFQLKKVSFSCSNPVSTDSSSCYKSISVQKPSGTQSGSNDHQVIIPDSLNNVSFNVNFDSAAYMKTINGTASLASNFFLEITTEWTNSGGQAVAGRKDKNISFYYKIPFSLTVQNCASLTDKMECNKACVWASGTNRCYSKTDENACSILKADSNECTKSTVCSINSGNRCELTRNINTRKAIDQQIDSNHPVPKGYEENGGILPTCSFSGSCRDVNVLVELGLRVMSYIFSIVAGLAFVMFIYGGFTWIFSFGNSEKVKKGQQVFVYAIIGLVIVFSAYILVKFLLDALNVADTFRGIF